MHVCFASDSHRESGVFSFGSALSPVESCPLRSYLSSHLPVYSQLSSIASEDWTAKIARSLSGKEEPSNKGLFGIARSLGNGLPKTSGILPHNWIDRSGFRAGRHPRAISGRPPLVFSARLLPRGAQRQSRTTWLQRARAELLVSQSDHGINAHGPARRDPAGGERYER